eukprot:6953565-Heterocapsa_arctica.AAC.1
MICLGGSVESRCYASVDNDSATASRFQKYSPQLDSAQTVGNYWLTAARFRICLFIDRVECKSNISDGPSQCDFPDMIRLSAIFNAP